MGCGWCTMEREKFDSSQCRLDFNLHYRIDIQLMVTLKQKKHLIQTIKTPERFFQINIGRYGGEVAMGTITKDQYDYWFDNDSFEQYMIDIDYDPEGANKDIPVKAQFNKPFYEYEDICHLSGPELADSQMIYVQELDKLGKPMQDGDGGFVKDIEIDMADLKSLDADVKCTEEHHASSKSLKDQYYFFGQYFNKGGWTTDRFKTGPEGFNPSKLKIEYVNADGFNVFNEIIYDDVPYYLEEDSTGKSSSFFVNAGENVQESQ